MDFLLLVLKGITWIVIFDAISSWFVRSPDRFPRNITTLITGPLYAPIRAVLKPERTGGIDFSPLILIVALNGIGQLISRSMMG